MENRTVFHFYVELDDYVPAMWRRIQIASDFSLALLGNVCRLLYEMNEDKSSFFEVPVLDNMLQYEQKISPGITRSQVSEIMYSRGKEELVFYRYIDDDDDADGEYNGITFEQCDFSIDSEKYAPSLPIHDAKMKPIRHAVEHSGDIMFYHYEFNCGGWTLKLKLEKLIEVNEADDIDLLVVLDGRGYGIIEECNGPAELSRLVKAYRNKNNPDHSEARYLIGSKGVSPAKFDVDAKNRSIIHQFGKQGLWSPTGSSLVGGSAPNPL